MKKPHEYSLDPDVDGNDPTARFLRCLPSMIHFASKSILLDNASNGLSYSYNETLVVAAGQFSRFEPGLVTDIYRGNTKRSLKAKRCAELQLGGAATKYGFCRMDGLFVASNCSPNRIESIVGRSMLTLHPCGDCSNDLKSSPLTRSTMPVLTHTFGTDFIQAYSLGQVHELNDYPDSFVESGRIPVENIATQARGIYLGKTNRETLPLERRDELCLQVLRETAVWP